MKIINKFTLIFLILILSCTKTITKTEYIELPPITNYVIDTLYIFDAIDTVDIQDSLYVFTQANLYRCNSQKELYFVEFLLRVSHFGSIPIDSIIAHSQIHIIEGEGENGYPGTVIEELEELIPHDGQWEYMDFGWSILTSTCYSYYTDSMTYGIESLTPTFWFEIIR